MKNHSPIIMRFSYDSCSPNIAASMFFIGCDCLRIPNDGGFKLRYIPAVTECKEKGKLSDFVFRALGGGEAGTLSGELESKTIQKRGGVPSILLPPLVIFR